MGTHAHKLTALKPAALPRRFIALSAQPCVSEELGRPRTIVHKLRLGAVKALRRDGSVHWSEWDGVFDSLDSILTLIDRYSTRREPTWIVCSRLAYHWTLCGLGLAGLYRRIEVLGYNFSGRVQTAMVQLNGKRINLVDSENYLDKDLAWIAAALGSRIPVPPCDTDADSDALDKARLECAALADMVRALVHLSGEEMQGAWGWSLGGLAWHSYRAGLLGDPIYVHADEEATAMERAAYLGGRNECRFIGSVGGEVDVVDYNSLYASCMAAEPQPCKLIGVHGEDVQSLERGLASGLLAVAQVTVDARKYDYPHLFYPGYSGPPAQASPLPAYCAASTQWRKEWARGIFSTTLATGELKRAVEGGEVRTVSRVGWYSGGNCFERFVSYWYAQRLKWRQKAKTFEEAICKRILTVLPGKFGQHAREWTDCPDIQCRDLTGHWWAWSEDDGDWHVYRALNGCAQVYGVPGEWKHSCPAISAHVTSAARVATDRAVEIAGDCDTYYYDTDALHVTALGLQRLRDAGLLHETDLGRLKLKGQHDGATYRNARDFTIGQIGNVDNGQARITGRRGQNAEICSANRASDRGPGTNNPGQDQSAIRAGSDINNLFRAWSDSWRSCVAVTALKRFRYSGRVDRLGWVQPNWLTPPPEKVNLFGGK